MNKWSVLDAEVEDRSTDPPKMRKVFDPHPAQLEMMEDEERYVVNTCGRRLGKSRSVGHEFLPPAILAKKMASFLKSEGRRHEYWSVGPKYSDSEKPFRVFWNICRRLEIPFDKPGSYFSPSNGEMTVSLWDGAFIYSAKSAQYPDTLVGEALSGVHMEEAAKMKQIIWTQAIMPSLSDFEGWAKFTSTPEGKNWYYQLHMDAIKPANLNWNAHRIPSWKNPWVFTETGRELAKRGQYDLSLIPETDYTIDEHVKRMMHLMEDNPGYTSFEIIKIEGLQIDSEIAQMANDNTIPMFQQEVAAEFTDFVGKVFKEFDEETHTRLLSYNPNWETIAAVDYGYRNPNVWLLIQIGPWGEINILEELYQSDLAPDEFAREILRRGLLPDTCTEFYPDPASPGDTATLESIFRRAGKRVKARAHTGGELNNRLNLIRLAFRDRITDSELSGPQWTSHPARPDQRRPRMMVSTRCPMTIYECSEYRYPEKRDEQQETSTKRFDLPMKKDDHTPEAIGRFLAGKYHSTQAQYGGGTRISTARFLNGLGSKSYAPNGAAGGGYGPNPAGIPNIEGAKLRGTWKQE